jgi:hypothetical protein
MAERGEDGLLFEDSCSLTSFDEEEWEWDFNEDEVPTDRS